MATTATATKTMGLSVLPGIGHIGTFTLLLDTTDASGLLTIDLTTWFKTVETVTIGGSLAATGYVCEMQKIVRTTDITATNVKMGIYEAGADAAALDPVASTDVSAVVTGLTITVVGTPAAVTSWA